MAGLMHGAGVHLVSAEETEALGAAVGRALGGGQCVALVGPLGAGKTTFVRGLAKGLDIRPGHVVRSPSFALVHSYPARLTVLHADFYRLTDARQALELHPWDTLAADELALVEWADVAPGSLPPDSLWIRLEPCGSGRDLHVFEPQGDLRWLTEPDLSEFAWSFQETPIAGPPSAWSSFCCSRRSPSSGGGTTTSS